MRGTLGVLLALTALGAHAATPARARAPERAAAVPVSAAAPSPLRDIQLLAAPDSTRLVIDTGAQSASQVPYKVFTLDNPHRVVVDLPASAKPAHLPAVSPGGLVRALRSGPREGGIRLVLDTADAVTPTTFAISAADGYGYRLVIDMVGAASPAASAPPAPVAPVEVPDPRPAVTPIPTVTPAPHAPVIASVEPPPAETGASRALATSKPVNLSSSSQSTVQLRQKPIVIAIDAGHGGVDPGAHGPTGLEEKTVTLAVARRLARLVDAQPGMRAYLTRDTDTFVELRERTRLAREAQADLFVSIHCNAVTNRTARGTAVYVLSDHGASSEQARWLASRENSADMVGGVTLQDKDNQVAAVLLDISQTATMEASFDLAGRMLNSLGRINTLQREQVQQAGFMVLKSPDIPSVLVETAFITNDTEERLLGDSQYQERLASSLLDGIRGYFANYRPLQQVATDDDDARPRSVPVKLARKGSRGTHLR